MPPKSPVYPQKSRIYPQITSHASNMQVPDTATNYNPIQHAATHRNTLQHTATVSDNQHTAKEPCSSVKEPHLSAKAPYLSATKPLLHIRNIASYTSAQKPYLFSKEPHLSATEVCKFCKRIPQRISAISVIEPASASINLQANSEGAKTVYFWQIPPNSAKKFSNSAKNSANSAKETLISTYTPQVHSEALENSPYSANSAQDTQS